MTTALLLLTQIHGAWAHGGEEHAEAPPPLSPEARVLISGEHFDAAVLVDPDGQHATVMLADHDSSAPITEGSLTLNLSGPGSAELTLQASPAPGVWRAESALVAGLWAGALVVNAAGVSELLSVDGLIVGAEEHEDEHEHEDRLPLLPLALGLGGLALGYGLGRRRGLAAATLGLALFTPGVRAHGGDEHDAPKVSASGALSVLMESQFLVGLRTLPLREQDFQPHFRAMGALHGAPESHAALRAPIEGVLRAAAGGWPHPGASVQAGQVLAWVEERPGAADRASIVVARADASTRLAQAREELALAQRDLDQLAQLGEALSPRERMVRQQAWSRASEALASAEREAAALKEASRTPIIAPFSGRVAQLSGHPSDQVNPGDPVFVLQGEGGLVAELQLPIQHRTQVGALARLSIGDQQAQARVLDPGLLADPQTGQILATALVEQAPPDWMPGLPLTAWLPEGASRQALALPEGALLESGGQRFCFVKTGPESFELRELRLGDRDGAAWELEQGLLPGERVVVEGAPVLRGLVGR